LHNNRINASANRAQLHLLQQEIVVPGEALETLQLNTRAAIDALRLTIEGLGRCLHLVHPELADPFATVRAEAIRTLDPEIPYLAGEDT
jgi:hypothetical protein